jgi:acyl dehydratase
MSLFDPSRPTITIAQLQAKIGTETGVSRWFEISQARIDAFAEVTEDRQFIHVDPVAAKATPFGGTVAHGFLTMSMLSAIAYDALPRVEGLAMGVNYGFDKVRFVAPVPRALASADASSWSRSRSARRPSSRRSTR